MRSEEGQAGVGILGLGWFLPPTVRGNDFWPADWKPLTEHARRKDILALERTSTGESPTLPPEVAAALAKLGDDPFRGARSRHIIDDGVEVSDMEAEAARRAMHDAGVRPDEIDLVMVASTVPDRLLPGNGPAVQAKCELVNAVAWNLEVGCSVMQPMLVTAAGLIRSGIYRRVLCVTSSALSRLIDPLAPMAPAFGDGASAAVIGPVPDGGGLLGQWMRTDGSLRDGAVTTSVVDGKAQRRWDRCGVMRFTTMDPDIIKTAGRRAVEYCREACDGALASAGLTMDDVSFYVGNQSQGWFVEACRRGLGLPAEKAIDTFAEVGNLGPATTLYNLERARRRGSLKDGDVVLVYSPGVGLTRAAIAYRWVSAVGAAA